MPTDLPITHANPVTDKPYYQYWGKAQPATEPATDGQAKQDQQEPTAAYHMLPYHSLDVAAVGFVLLEKDRFLCQRLARLAGLSEKQVKYLVAWALALHDLGKFSDPFQWQVPELAKKLQPERCSKESFSPYMGHATPSFEIWQYDILPHYTTKVCLFHENMDDFVRPLLLAVTGHHGKPPDPSGGLADGHFSSFSIGAAKCFSVDVTMLFLSENKTPIIPFLFQPTQQQVQQSQEIQKTQTPDWLAFSWVLAGLAVFCDWMGSNQTYFTYQDTAEPLGSYFKKKAYQRAKNALTETRVLPTKISPIPLQQIYAHIHKLSPLQQWAVDLAEHSSVAQNPAFPAQELVILEDITGSGKTEAAVLNAMRLMQQKSADGIFFALPTMATANAMYARIKRIYRSLFQHDADADSLASLMLAHSQQRLALRLEELGARRERVDYSNQQNQQNQQNSKSKQNNAEETATEHRSRWLADNRKKALLAQVGIGTLDQALLGIIPSKHAPLRLLGLHRHVLIVDEVHAYDSYMAKLLENLLFFHAALGGSAILLSATLPQSMRESLQRAFCRGLVRAYPSLHHDTHALFPSTQHTNQHTNQNTAHKSEQNTTHNAGQHVPYPLATRCVLEAVATEKTEKTEKTENAEDSKNTTSFGPNMLRINTTQDPIGVREGSEKSVSVAFIHDEKQTIAYLLDVATAGGCAVWIRSSVADAVETYADLQNAVASHNTDEPTKSVRVFLFHARFTLADRLRIEQDIVARFGPDAPPKNRAHTILIATQVVEQSLDLDFDAMVTDLAPIDLLIQRAGRLHRHKSRDAMRPSLCTVPTLHILAPRWQEEPSENWLHGAPCHRTRFVYPDHGKLWLTYRSLCTRGMLRIPQDARALIEETYGIDAQDDIPEGLSKSNITATGEQQSAKSIAADNQLRFADGYRARGRQQDWKSDVYTPTRLSEGSTNVALGIQQTDDTQTPLCSSPDAPHDAILAWNLSLIAIPAHLLPPEAAELLPTQGKYTKILPLTPVAGMPDTYTAQVSIKDKPTRFVYSHHTGFAKD